MNKQEFLSCLRRQLSGLPQETVEEQLAFYSEMIDDRVEDGIAEETAVAELGDTAALVEKIVADMPLTKPAKPSEKPKRHLASWEIVLLTAGSPVWLSLLIAVFAIVLSLYITLWAVIISLWSIFVSFIGSAIGAVITGIVFIVTGNVLAGIAMIGASLVLAGLSIFAFFGCKASTKSLLQMTKMTARGIKRCFVKKEGSK